MNKKLHIPGEPEEDGGELAISMMIAIAILMAVAYYFATQAPLQAGKSPLADFDITDPAQQAQIELRRRSIAFEKMSGDELAGLKWDGGDTEAALRFGPRAATEAWCSARKGELTSGTLDKSVSLELEKTLDRRAGFAPWTCMARLALDGELAAGDLEKEMSQWWQEVEAHEGAPGVIGSVVDDFRETRDRPKNPKFYSWLRMCALNYSYSVAPSCRRILSQISPQQGADMLLMLEEHWSAGPTAPREHAVIVDALGHMAIEGQPDNWRVKETRELPDYDVDFRQAAVAYLCRVVNTPTRGDRLGEGPEEQWAPYDELPAMASEALRSVAGSGARAYEPRLLARWRETCRIGFGGLGGFREGEERIPVPFLAVWNGEPASLPRYSFRDLHDRGLCPTQEGYPLWYCGSALWQGDGQTLERALSHFFIETRYMEWDDRFEAEKSAAARESSPATGSGAD